MGKAYKAELDYLPQALRWAGEQNVDLLARSMRLLGDRGLLAIGSGGSYTAAAFAADLHFTVFSRVSRAVTPLETFALPDNPAAVGGLLLSAEGKNSDILGAARELLVRGVATVGVTLRAASPLVELCSCTGAGTIATFEMPWRKDGYLATNSLAATLVVLARAYGCVDTSDVERLVEWAGAFRQAIGRREAAFGGRRRALVLSGLAGRIGAIDLESKLTESALAFAQISDFRQFAHGRHLQLKRCADDLVIVSFFLHDDALARETLRLLPAGDFTQIQVELPSGGRAFTEIAGVLAAMAITEAWATAARRDPGQPDVPQFGRRLHSLDASQLVSTQDRPPAYVRRKLEGCEHAHGQFESALDSYLSRLGLAHVKALVCDFDGTFCDTMRRYEDLAPALVPEITRLLAAGVHIAFATGRGKSLVDDLRAKLQPSALWPGVTLGCYSGSFIFQLDESPDQPRPDARLETLARWLSDAKLLGSGQHAKVDCGQLSLRSLPAEFKHRVMAAVHEWLAMNGVGGWRVLASGHSLDIVTETAGKQKVVEHVCSILGTRHDEEVLRIGDAGEYAGNDHELLSQGLSLSVDVVSADPKSCWNLLPATVRGACGTLHYLRALEAQDGCARFRAEFLDTTRTTILASVRRGLRPG